MSTYDLPHRPRRLRTSPVMRNMVAETSVAPSDLILPVFVRENATENTPISSMPGVVQHTLDSLVDVSKQARDAGVAGVMLFGVPEKKDAQGSGSIDPDGILNVGLRAVRDAVGDDLLVMGDLCLDEFTDHGHCGVLDAQGRVDNDATLDIYAQMAVAQAQAGAHVLGPSGMMDGQIGVIRAALDLSGHDDVAVMAYSAKYASAAYGPFREAVQSSLQGDRATYQQDPRNRTESLREAMLEPVRGLVRVGEARLLDPERAEVELEGETLRADLVLGADGLHSGVRAAAGLDAGTRRAGYGAWRGVTPEPFADVLPSETWGRGERFGLTPLPDGRVCWFAVLPDDGRPRDVAEVAVIGDPDEVMGERAAAVVALRDGCSLTLDELVSFLRDRKIGSYQLPERLEVRPELPRNAVGKLLKRDLRRRPDVAVFEPGSSAAPTAALSGEPV